jgi:hypothetical protein
MSQLIEQIKAWGIAKGITGPNGKGTLLGQLSKTSEELTETRDAAVRIDAFEQITGQASSSEIVNLMDGIGDTTVTLILAAEMAGLDFEACLQIAYDEIKGRTGRMENGIFIKDAP